MTATTWHPTPLQITVAMDVLLWLYASSTTDLERDRIATVQYMLTALGKEMTDE